MRGQGFFAYAVGKGLALTLTLSPRRGNPQFPRWKEAEALEFFSLSWGRGLG
jgi:hypothetical protein